MVADPWFMHCIIPLFDLSCHHNRRSIPVVPWHSSLRFAVIILDLSGIAIGEERTWRTYAGTCVESGIARSFFIIELMLGLVWNRALVDLFFYYYCWPDRLSRHGNYEQLDAWEIRSLNWASHSCAYHLIWFSWYYQFFFKKSLAGILPMI